METEDACLDKVGLCSLQANRVPQYLTQLSFVSMSEWITVNLSQQASAFDEAS